MCGRYTLTDPKSVPSFFEISETRIPVRYNIAPSQIVPVIVCDSQGKRQLLEMEWGISSERLGLRSRSSRLINIRSETGGRKKVFRAAFQKRRCLVPASGFYEWKKEGTRRSPYYFYPSSDPLLGFAAIWEPHDNGEHPSFAILTCPADQLVCAVHDRMPVSLKREHFSEWLNPGVGGEKLNELLASSSDQLACHPVSTLVNSPQNDQKECIQPLQETPPSGFKF